MKLDLTILHRKTAVGWTAANCPKAHTYNLLHQFDPRWEVCVNSTLYTVNRHSKSGMDGLILGGSQTRPNLARCNHSQLDISVLPDFPYIFWPKTIKRRGRLENSIQISKNIKQYHSFHCFLCKIWLFSYSPLILKYPGGTQAEEPAAWLMEWWWLWHMLPLRAM